MKRYYNISSFIKNLCFNKVKLSTVDSNQSYQELKLFITFHQCIRTLIIIYPCNKTAIKEPVHDKVL